MISSPVFQEYVHSPEFLHALDLPFNSSLNFSPLGQGEYNTNYRFSHPVTGKELVLRINTGSQMHLSDQIGYEFSTLNPIKYSRFKIIEALEKKLQTLVGRKEREKK